MADTGLKSPTSTGGKFNTWTNPSNAYSSDDSWATKTTDGTQRKQSYEGFGFEIPAGATIDGIFVQIEGHAEELNCRTYMGVYNASSTSWSDFSVWDAFPQTNDGTMNSGAPLTTNLWGKTWAVDDFSDANFSVAFTAEATTNDHLSVDQIQVKVYYTSTVDYHMDATVGEFALTGVNVDMTKTLNMTTSTGNYALTGFDAIMSRGYGIIAEVGAYTLTGVNVSMTKALQMAVSVGSYALTGIDITITKTLNLVVQVGEYILTGINVALVGLGSWKYHNTDKNSATATSMDKNSASIINTDKNTATFTNLNKTEW